VSLMKKLQSMRFALFGIADQVDQTHGWYPGFPGGKNSVNRYNLIE
jgi:hypothetical protein